MQPIERIEQVERILLDVLSIIFGRHTSDAPPHMQLATMDVPGMMADRRPDPVDPPKLSIEDAANHAANAAAVKPPADNVATVKPPAANESGERIPQFAGD